MIEAADIVAMLSERVSKRDTYQPKGNKQIQELIEYLFETIQIFLSTSSFEIYDESTLDQIDSSDKFSGNESQASEDNQELESEEEIEDNEEQMDSTEEEEENDDKQPTRKFSLDYMKRVLDYYDEVDQNGKHKHSWKSVSHRFTRIPHRQYIVRFRDYVSRHGSKHQKVHEIDSYVFTMFKEARDQSLCIHDADLQRWAIVKAREQSMYEFDASNCQSIRNADEIDSTAEDFVNAVRAEMKNYSSSEIFNTEQVNLNDLPNLKSFSLTSFYYLTDRYDTEILPLFRHMPNLEELTLYIMVYDRTTFIDGTHIYNEILVHLPRLHIFNFYISTCPKMDHLVRHLSKDDIQRTLINNIKYQPVDCIVNSEYKFPQCHVFSLPFMFERLDDIGNTFPNIIFNHV
ncbi:unnamed protein product [Rotaria sordida]|uniref:Uncharacterized protein n=1 Tax=Rotaria sordida TaxID=392033 RepID=A0A814I512_9BILA|nr:unnamed protein product [Rotaria sordida]